MKFLIFIFKYHKKSEHYSQITCQMWHMHQVSIVVKCSICSKYMQHVDLENYAKSMWKFRIPWILKKYRKSKKKEKKNRIQLMYEYNLSKYKKKEKTVKKISLLCKKFCARLHFYGKFAQMSWGRRSDCCCSFEVSPQLWLKCDASRAVWFAYNFRETISAKSMRTFSSAKESDIQP